MPSVAPRISIGRGRVSSTALRCWGRVSTLAGVAMNRIEILKGFLKDNPDDSFSRYALALEYAKLGQHDDAVREFETVKKNDPDYVATYFQLGQLYQKIGQTHE